MTTTNTSKPIMQSLGSFAGKTAAYAWEGTRLASSQFATGAAEGYAEKAAELRAKREALGLTNAAPAAPAPVKQRKAAVTRG
jgi:hypothetical protein